MKQEINSARRRALKTGGSLGLMGLLSAVGLIRPGLVQAEWKKAAFEAKTMEEVLAALGVATSENNATIFLSVPEIAENGAVVPVTVTSSLAHIEQISILVDKNPNVLAAQFVFPEGTEGFITARVKMGQTAMVIALVKADGKFYRAAKEVKVTAGGCGG